MGLTRINNQALPTLDSDKLPSGTVLQVKQAAFTGSDIDTTSTSYVSTSVTHSITPTSTSSEIFVMLSGGHFSYYAAGDIYVKVVRTIGSTSTDVSSSTQWSRPHVGGNSYGNTISGNYLDDPNTTSAITYTVHIKTNNGSRLVLSNSSNLITMTLMEIAG